MPVAEPFVHVTNPGGDAPRCGQAQPHEQVIDWDDARDPDGPAFNCPACWAALAGPGVEPMGGSRP
jgi:hypothetical protein